jgi:hypothetical protein
MKVNALVFALVVGFFGVKLLFPSSAASCTVSSTLVNSCRPWLGAYVNKYPAYATGDIADNVAAQESRIGRQNDVLHMYDNPGSTLSGTALTFAKRSNTYLMLNWKPAYKWSDAAGGNSSVNSQIDAMADSIKAIAPKKIFLTVFHEPEDDMSPGGSPSCGSSFGKGTAGTTADYVDMWHNVRARFNARGVSNVVWVMNYMSYSGYACELNDLWPGNSYVDWVMWDNYAYKTRTFDAMTSYFTGWLTQNTDASHAYTSKPWGFNEYGTYNMTQPNVYKFWQDAKVAIDNNTYPNIKMYNVFDTIGTTGDHRLLYDDSGNIDQTEQNYYNAFADDPHFTDTYYEGGSGGGGGGTQPPADTTDPSVGFTAPAANSTVSGTITVSASASDNIKVSSVKLSVDSTVVATDTTSPYNFSLDTTRYPDGSHTLKLQATDSSSNSSEASRNVTFEQPSGDSGSSGGGSTTVIDTGTDTTPSKPVEVSGQIDISPLAAHGSVSVDGKQVAGTKLDTTKLTNGTHKITVTSNGDTTYTYIKVHNSWHQAVVNELRAHPVAYTASSAGVVALLVGLWVVRPYISGLIFKLKTRNYVHF